MNKSIDDFFKSNGKVKTNEKKKDDSNNTEPKGKKVAMEEKQSGNEISKKVVGDFPKFDDFIGDLDTWEEHLKDFISSNPMKNIYNFVKSEYSSKIVFPPKELIFNAFKVTKWDNLKIVIIGQDPYPNIGEAMGLSFSVPKNIKVPKSLVNIYKCLDKDKNIKNFKIPNHGDLTKWAEQGVFLLNATLTVVHKLANSHQKTSGWSNFTDYVIKQISQQKQNVVFLLWGKFAIDKKKFIDSKKHHIIENIHPSPLAASKGDFSASLQFSEANIYLEKNDMEPIDWSL